MNLGTFLTGLARVVLFIMFLMVAPFFSCGAHAALPDMNDVWAQSKWAQAPEIQLDYFPYSQCFKKASERYRIPPLLLLAVARGESDFDRKAKSSANCYGIMQIKWPGTARDLGFHSLRELYEPCRNIMAGAKYLRMMLDQHGGNIHLALAAYNRGPGAVYRGISLQNVPRKGVWYSGYIYHHLKAVRALSSGATGGRYQRERKLAIIAFNEIFRAEGFIGYVRKEDPSIRLEWFRMPGSRYSVVLLYKSEREKNRSIRRLDKIGYKVEVSRGY